METVTAAEDAEDVQHPVNNIVAEMPEKAEKPEGKTQVC